MTEFVVCVPAQELQNDLEAEQVKVNSLTHMVVVVDENSGESATAALEEQLQVSFQALKLIGQQFIIYQIVFFHYVQNIRICVQYLLIASLCGCTWV